MKGVMLGRCLLAFAISCAPAFCGIATLITFDDLGTEVYGNTPIQNGYAGLNWNNFYYVTPGIEFQSSGYYAGMVSAPNVGFNGYRHPASFSSSTPFTLDSAYLMSAFKSNLWVRVTGYNSDGVPIDTERVMLHDNGSTFVQFDWSDLSSVRFSAHEQYFGIDNLMLDMNPTPEPAFTWVGLGILACLAGFNWRRFSMRKAE